jgi:hypothetical protein
VNAGGIIDVNTDYNNFENAVSAAQSTCCAINTAISEVDSDETLAALGILTPKIQKVLSDIAVKVKDYNFVTMIFVHARLKSIEENSQKLNTCFSVFTPPSKASILAGYFKQIEDAIKTTKSA